MPNYHPIFINMHIFLCYDYFGSVSHKYFHFLWTSTLDGLNSSSKNFNLAWSMKAPRTYWMFYFVCLIPPKPMDASSSKCQQIFLSWMVLIPYRWKYHSTWFFLPVQKGYIVPLFGLNAKGVILAIWDIIRFYVAWAEFSWFE